MQTIWVLFSPVRHDKFSATHTPDLAQGFADVLMLPFISRDGPMPCCPHVILVCKQKEEWEAHCECLVHAGLRIISAGQSSNLNSGRLLHMAAQIASTSLISSANTFILVQRVARRGKPTVQYVILGCSFPKCRKSELNEKRSGF